jgi:NAD(P)H-dependent FMN reductase
MKIVPNLLTSDFIVRIIKLINVTYWSHVNIKETTCQQKHITDNKKGDKTMRIALVAGSNRKNATSTILLKYIETILTSQKISVSFIDLAKLPLPLFTPDNEDLHQNVLNLLHAIQKADGVIFATPEYHGSISGVLKNALDYISNEHISGKAVLSVSSAGGPLGISSLTHLQTIVRYVHGINCPEWISIGYGTNTFDEDGAPTDEGTKIRVQTVLNSFIELTKSLSHKPVAQR